jgi:glycosyltransferase involved in cell wall biosynthesis
MFNKSIAYVQYANPAAYPPLEHSSRIFAREGWEVLFLGIPALGAESLSFPRHDRIKVRQISFCQAGWRQKLHYVQFCLWVLFSVLRWRSRWVYASDLMSCPVALILSFLPGFRVIYHEHDSPTLETRDRISKISKFMRLVLWARRRLARRAQLCVLPNERRAERFRAESGSVMCNGYRSTVVVWNCPSLEEVSEPRDAHDGSELWVLYHGSIVPSRLPLTVFEAVAILPEAVKLHVIGYET